jgi:2'-5' RNA ligase
MTKRAIVVFPRFQQMDVINLLRRQFDPLADFIEPHITLVFPFDSEIPTLELRTHIRQAAKGLTSFPIQLQGITGSEDEYLFLNVQQGKDQLTTLHDRLYTGILAQYLLPTQPYIPHLTVGRLGNVPAFTKALEEAQKMTSLFQTILKEIITIKVEERARTEIVVTL